MTRNPTIFIIGGDSLIGRTAKLRLRTRYENIYASTRKGIADRNSDCFFDLRFPESLKLPEHCDIVIIAAAMTGLAKCRFDPVLAHRINVEAPVEIAKQAFRRNCRVIFFSTNLVFSGTTPDALPTDKKNPLSLYGALKAEAEDHLCKMKGELTIVRLGKVLSPEVEPFKTWINELVAGQSIRAFSDLKMAPISINKVIDGIEKIIDDRLTGIFHLNCEQEISFFEAANYICNVIGANKQLVVETTAAEAGIPVEERPRYVSLSPGSFDVPRIIECKNAKNELSLGLSLERKANE